MAETEELPIPACCLRQELEGVSDRFFCAHPLVKVPAGIVRPRTCRVCIFANARPAGALRNYDPQVAGRLSGSCRHLGGLIGLRDCSTCAGHVQVKVFACTHPRHGETTASVCLNCQDFTPRPLRNDYAATESSISAHLPLSERNTSCS